MQQSDYAIFSFMLEFLIRSFLYGDVIIVSPTSVGTKAGQNVPKDFLVRERMTECRHGISVTLHLLEVGRSITLHSPVHTVYKILWASKCQPNHKVFFWFLLNDRSNTRGLLRRKNMHVDTYTCENCIFQREETLALLFLRCNFAKTCWATIGVVPPRTLCPQRATYRLK
jgi:hypothetical protein